MLPLNFILSSSLGLIHDISSRVGDWTSLQMSIQSKHEPSGYFNWTSISPSKSFKWSDCYEEHECARLEVPLKWQHPDENQTAAIAVIRLPAKVPRNDPKFGGSILLNPGGPGGSGVEFLRWSGWEIQANVDGDKHFEIVSFDPRGAGRTYPSASCFQSDLDRDAFLLKLGAIGTADESELAFATQWQAAKAFGEACSHSATKHMTTLDVAHDMIAMIDALDLNTKKPLLNYWGFSYGTFLGNTFASAFPDRVGHMVLDGVVDANDYSRTGWSNNLVNTEDALRFFYSSCWQAGTEKCPLSEENLDDLVLKVQALLKSLAVLPLPVTYNGTIDFVKYTDVRQLMFTALYLPWQRFPLLAQQLQDLFRGNTTSIASSLTHLRAPPTKKEVRNAPPMKPATHAWDNDLPKSPYSSWDVSRVVACTDGDPIVNRTWTEHKAYLNTLLEESPNFGGLWIDLPTACVHFPLHLRPDDSSRFTGPFNSKLKDYSDGGKPILWIGNDADPVCPLVHARSMSRGHEGSVVLEVKQVGHCSGPLNPNQCVYEKVRRFFNHGVLPDEGERICPGEVMPWP